VSDQLPRVFVGTMYCGEGDYDECMKAVRSQAGVAVQQVTVANLPEREAHNRLWKAWRDVQHDGFSMFVKVDADTVLAHDEVLLEFWKLMTSDARITGIQAPLLDYFTDGYINGLNCFSPRVTFQDTSDELFCDRQVDVDHDVVVKADAVPPTLRHAGYHCFHTTERQAFHFGLHRALKGQADIVERVRQAWLRHGDRQRALALRGADAVLQFCDGRFNYSDERFIAAFNTAVERFDEQKTTL
jgi:hypothetical protein